MFLKRRFSGFPSHNLVTFKNSEWEALRKPLFKVLAIAESWVANSTVFTVLAGGVDMTVDEGWEGLLTRRGSPGHWTTAGQLPLCINLTSFKFFITITCLKTSAPSL